MKRIVLATALGLILASPGLAPGQSISEEARLQIQAAEQKARVEEAKELLREQGRLEERIKDITKRLGELDAGAKARLSFLSGSGTITTHSYSLDTTTHAGKALCYSTQKGNYYEC